MHLINAKIIIMKTLFDVRRFIESYKFTKPFNTTVLVLSFIGIIVNLVDLLSHLGDKFTSFISLLLYISIFYYALIEYDKPHEYTLKLILAFYAFYLMLIISSPFVRQNTRIFLTICAILVGYLMGEIDDAEECYIVIISNTILLFISCVITYISIRINVYGAPPLKSALVVFNPFIIWLGLSMCYISTQSKFMDVYGIFFKGK